MANPTTTVRSNEVKVVDATNRARILGYLEKPSRSPMGRTFRMPVMIMARAYNWDEEVESICSARSSCVDFEYVSESKSDKVDGDEWSHTIMTKTTIIFATSAPLEDLMKVKTFRLHGETKAAQQERFQRSAYGY